MTGAAPSLGARHNGVTGVKLHIIDALHAYQVPVSTTYVARYTGYNEGYVRRLLTELHDEGIVDRARDGAYTGRGAGPYIWSCCGS